MDSIFDNEKLLDDLIVGYCDIFNGLDDQYAEAWLDDDGTNDDYFGEAL